MRPKFAFLLGGLVLATMQMAFAESGMTLPKTIEAGSAFSIQTTGNGTGVLYIVGPGQVLKRDVQLGETTFFDAGSLYNAGHYVAVLAAGSSTEKDAFDVVPASKPATVSFLAKPSRLSVGLHGGITGAVYVFDTYQNLITKPVPVTFELLNQSSATQTHTVATREGAAWTAMDSTTKEGFARFVASAGGITSTRVIEEVPGDPCGLKMSAKQSGKRLDLETDPVRDCSGNAVPDGTIVTFTETYNGAESTVDVPLKRGIAQVEMPAYNGAKISVASGVVLGNEIRWGK